MTSKLFVDGSNLFRGITDILPAGSYFDFSDILTAVRKDCQVDTVHFYASYMILQRASTITDQLKVRAQIEFLNNVRKIPNLEFFKGYYSGKGKEKGVDVHLAVDMVKQAMENEFDQAIIMTGDDDLTYPVELLRKYKKKVTLAAFCTRFPFGISYRVDECFLYDYNSHFQSSVLPTIKKPPHKLQIRHLPSSLPVQKVQ